MEVYLCEVLLTELLSDSKISLNRNFVEHMYKYIPEVYSEPCQMSKKGYFAKLVNGFWEMAFNAIFTKSPILDVWQGSDYASVSN